MTTWSRRLGASVKTGLTWAAAWFGVGLIILVVALLLTGETGADVPYPLGFAVLGFFAGTLFSGVLGKVRGVRPFHQMSIVSVAAWGGLSGLLFSGTFVGLAALAGDGLPDVVTAACVFALASAASAVVSLGLARWGQVQRASPAGRRSA